MRTTCLSCNRRTLLSRGKAKIYIWIKKQQFDNLIGFYHRECFIKECPKDIIDRFKPHYFTVGNLEIFPCDFCLSTGYCTSNHLILRNNNLFQYLFFHADCFMSLSGIDANKL